MSPVAVAETRLVPSDPTWVKLELRAELTSAHCWEKEGEGVGAGAGAGAGAVGLGLNEDGLGAELGAVHRTSLCPLA